MKRRLETLAYRLCWRGTRLTYLWSRIWFRWYCPYPIIGDWTAKACISAGECGCENGAREARAKVGT